MADIKRLNYFNSQFLVDTDFNDQQFYHRDMRLRHNRVLHTWGVADGGFNVTGSGKSASVGAGTAIDSQGREIILLASQALDLSAFVANADVYVTIQYQETASDPVSVGGTTKYTRWTESPKLQAATSAPPTDGSVVPLAIVHLDGNANITAIDLSIRPIASSKINPASSLQVASLTVTGGANVGGSLGVGMIPPSTGQMLDIASAVGAAGNSAIRALYPAGGGLAGTEFGALANRSGQWQAVYAKGGTGGAIALYTDGEVNMMNGNVGIGTNTPLGPLQIYSTAAPPATAPSGNNGLLLGSAGESSYKWIQSYAGVLALNLQGNNVGIGTTSATYKLHVAPGNQGLRVEGPTTAGGTSMSLGANGDFAIDAPGVTAGRFVVKDGGYAGVGTANPGAGLVVSGTSIWKSAIGIVNTTANMEWRLAVQADSSFGIVKLTGSTFTPVTILSSGNVGVGTAAPAYKLHVGTSNLGLRVEGPSTSGGTSVSLGGNGDFAIDAPGVAAGRFVVKDGGYVGIGTTSPGSRLDVSGEIVSNSLGAGGGNIRMISGNYGAFFRNDGADTYLLLTNSGDQYGSWNTLRPFYVHNANGDVTLGGNLRVNGAISAGGGKGGYVMDQFANNIGDALEQGDVVVICGDQPSHRYGADDNIPVPEVDLARRAYDTRVCGIVGEVYGEFKESEGTKPGRKSKEPKKGKAANPREEDRSQPRPFTSEELIQLERTKVESGQIGWMVTLGAFAHCKVDADIAPIKVGDLLISSPTKGHAQKLLDPSKAVGAILGKALGSLDKGKGKIPVLVTLH